MPQIVGMTVGVTRAHTLTERKREIAKWSLLGRDRYC